MFNIFLGRSQSPSSWEVSQLNHNCPIIVLTFWNMWHGLFPGVELISLWIANILRSLTLFNISLRSFQTKNDLDEYAVPPNSSFVWDPLDEYTVPPTYNLRRHNSITSLPLLQMRWIDIRFGARFISELDLILGKKGDLHCSASHAIVLTSNRLLRHQFILEVFDRCRYIELLKSIAKGARPIASAVIVALDSISMLNKRYKTPE